MKAFCAVVCFLASTVVAQNATAEAEAKAAQKLLQSMPKCGLSCLEQAVAASPCSPTDVTCSCTNATLTDQIELCVSQSCSIKESLTTKNTSATLCQEPVRSHSDLAANIGIAGSAIALLAYIMRMASRAVGEGSFFGNLGWDDAMMTFGLALVIPVSVLSVTLTDLGLGKDMWTVPFENITLVLKIYYFDEICYLAALPVIKISMLLTYLRIFQSERFRKIVFGVIAFNVCYAIAFILITVFQCRPISYSWTRWAAVPSDDWECTDINAQIFAAAAINVALDIVVIFMPMPLLWKMNMNMRKKILVMMMFGVGFFVTIVSILRLQYIIEFGNTHNITWDYTRIGYWSTIELHASVLCACMPAIRKLIKFAFPKMMGATSRKYGSQAYASNLSGPTMFNSGTDKTFTQVDARRKSSDVSNFIPLQDYPTSEQPRNFSQPYQTHSTGGYRTTDDV